MRPEIVREPPARGREPISAGATMSESRPVRIAWVRRKPACFRRHRLPLRPAPAAVPAASRPAAPGTRRPAPVRSCGQTKDRPPGARPDREHRGDERRKHRRRFRLVLPAPRSPYRVAGAGRGARPSRGAGGAPSGGGRRLVRIPPRAPPRPGLELHRPRPPPRRPRRDRGCGPRRAPAHDAAGGAGGARRPSRRGRRRRHPPGAPRGGDGGRPGGHGGAGPRTAFPAPSSTPRTARAAS